MLKYLFFYLLLCSYNAFAVRVNHQGLGDVLLIPYYTVNNDLNTLVSITNPTDASKAIKINIREGLNGYAVLSYNVYLNANDTWTFAFVPFSSTVPGVAGQDSAIQITSDASCAPFLVKAGQEFLPFEFIDGPQDMNRSREGFIEIIEMAELQGNFVTAAAHGNSDIPGDCSAFETAWHNDGVWHTESGGNVNQDLSPGTGGLMAQADIINVYEGINYSIPVVALDGFFATEDINHADPGNTSLSLDAAQPVATVVAENKNYELSFESGVDAVSAVLMANELIGNYALDSIAAGKSEAVFIQPTRRFYIADMGENNQPPYTQSNDPRILCPTVPGTNELSQYGGTEVNWLVSDRESQYLQTDLVFDPPPPRYKPALCDSVSVWQFLLPGTAVNSPAITGSDNFQPIYSPSNAVTENGFFKIKFLETRPLLGKIQGSEETIELMGLPVMGFTLQKFTNAGAVEGLLAQYGGSAKMSSKVGLNE